jgi:hypothetical protein
MAALNTDERLFEHNEHHAIIAERSDISMEKQQVLARLQAKFRGGRDRATHVTRVGLSIQSLLSILYFCCVCSSLASSYLRRLVRGNLFARF